MTSRPTLDEIYIRMLSIFAKRSTCTRRQVAAIFVDEYGRVLSCGYNGVPRGFTHCTDTPCKGATDEPGNTTNCEAVHAEQNAILNCSDLNRVNTVYCSCTPCYECAKMLANLKNLKRVVVNEAYADHRGFEILERAGIKIKDANNSISGKDDLPF